MGQAIIIKNINFSSFNIGIVHRQDQPIPVESISILGDSIVTNTATYSVSYIPSNTTQLGVTWSIVNGSSYASIDSQTGELTVLDGASSNNVKIRATSIFNQSIYGELDIVVSYIMHDCSLEVSLINGDFILHDWDNGVDIQPNHSGYLGSDSNGTSFNKSIGHGITYENNDYLKFKSFSLEVYIDETQTGTLSNTWGGIFGYNGLVGSEIPWALLVFNRYPSDGWRITGVNDSYALDTKTNAKSGVWHRICVKSNFDFAKVGSDESYTGKVYMDGDLLGTFTTPYNLSWAKPTSSPSLIIGNSWRLIVNGYTSTNVNPLCGTIRNIRIFRNELTDSEAITESTLN